MRKMLIGATAAVALLGGPALSADLSRPVTKAPPPPPPPVYNWTGCYVKGGVGYGMFNQDTRTFETDRVVEAVGVEVRTGGRGWLGTVGGGCDYQFSFFNANWVIGVYGDYDFSGIKGDIAVPIEGITFFGSEKQRSAWAVGGRIGYLITPSVLTYASGGFTQARFSGATLFLPSVPPEFDNLSVPRHTFSGFFVGGGYEYNLGWIPGLFWRTEYRFAQYDRENLDIIENGERPILLDDGRRVQFRIDTEKFVQTVRSELVWRWNWPGPVRASY